MPSSSSSTPTPSTSYCEHFMVLIIQIRTPPRRGKRRVVFMLVSRIANKLRMSEAIDVRNPSGIMDLAGHTYSRNFCYTTLDVGYLLNLPYQIFQYAAIFWIKCPRSTHDDPKAYRLPSSSREAHSAVGRRVLSHALVSIPPAHDGYCGCLPLL